MKLNKLFILTFISVGLFSAISCNRDGETRSSNDGKGRSHNMGMNCLGCHRKGGSGAGIFSVGGTIYDSVRQATNSGCIVKICTQPKGGGTELVSLTSDRNGNIYTTESVDFSAPRYVYVIGKTGNKIYMNGSITTGACNSFFCII